jgi:replicative DNA helicase
VKELTKVVSRVIAHEMRALGLLSEPVPAIPLPFDVAVEAEVVSAILSGHVKPSELAPLRAGHLFDRIHAYAFRAAELLESRGETINVEAVALQLEAVEVRGRIRQLLTIVEVCTPAACMPVLRRHVAWLVELAARRELIGVLLEVEAGLRVGSTTCDAARACIVNYFSES